MEIMKFNYPPSLYNTDSAEIILPLVYQIKPFNSVLDIGCGNGSWLTIAKKTGANEIFGLDGSGSENMLIEPSEFKLIDLSKDFTLDKKFDLTICLEVAEHLPLASAKQFIDNVSKTSNIILFSAAIPEQGGDMHLNENVPQFWNDLFKQNDFHPVDNIRHQIWNNEKIKWWYRQNTILYAHKSEVEILKNNLSTVNYYIHPELYNYKINELKYYYKVFYNPSFKDVLRLIRNFIIK